MPLRLPGGVRDRVAEHVKAGHTAEQTAAANPLAEFDAKWGQRHPVIVS